MIPFSYIHSLLLHTILKLIYKERLKVANMLFVIITFLYVNNIYCNDTVTSNHSNYLLVYKLLPPKRWEYGFLTSTPLISCSQPPQVDVINSSSIWTLQNNYTVIAIYNKTNQNNSYNITYDKKKKANITINRENIPKDFTNMVDSTVFDNITSNNDTVLNNHTFIIYGLPNISSKYPYCVKNKTRTLRIQIPSSCRQNNNDTGTLYTGIFDYSHLPVNISSNIEEHLISNYGNKSHRNCTIRQSIVNYLYNNMSWSEQCFLNGTTLVTISPTLPTHTVVVESSTLTSTQSTSNLGASQSSMITSFSSTSSKGLFTNYTGNR
ncbi:glycoprotein ORF-Q [Elephant endotheliotropic herpesvirus 1A]|nr:ser/thr-rich glycoprotein ORF-Q [Elephant endotheliotropic herpesvirus 1A]AYF58648.1 ser/thr-rich glycoprotein ORF-Q [Elephant endotheliotropic herpesvirus 1A]QYM88509.1 glycoprotein ORF-Q [Elephant endotheliotropic herpesvirus 1A]